MMYGPINIKVVLDKYVLYNKV